MGLPGDINNDGKLDSEDLELLRQLLNSEMGPQLLKHLPPDQQERLDINKDGKIDHSDLVLLCQLILENDVQSPPAFETKLAVLRSKLSS